MLSDKSVARIKSAASWLHYLSDSMHVYSKHHKKTTPCKLVFITLTLSSAQKHPDSYIVAHMLQPFLKWIDRQYGAKLYIWKAEIQPERWYKRNERCIHFHITTNRFIHYRRLQNKWNQLQLAHGYINPNQHPHSSEIKAVKNEKGFSSYMAKYISKKETDTALLVNCKVWGCSRILSTMNVTIGEDITPEFWNTAETFINQTTTGSIDKKHVTIHLTSLKKKKKVPDKILEIIRAQTEKIPSLK